MKVLVGVRPGPAGSPSPLSEAVYAAGGVRTVAAQIGMSKSRLSVITQRGQHRLAKDAAQRLAEHTKRPYSALFYALDTDV